MRLIGVMKKLILVRHAKSSWEYDVIDHERPLKKEVLMMLISCQII